VSTPDLVVVAGIVVCAVLFRLALLSAFGRPKKPRLIPSASSDEGVTKDPKAIRPAAAIIAELRINLAVRERAIIDLREKGKRVVADRDRWEAAAKKYEAEIAGLKAGPGAGRASGGDAEKFRELKTALAKMFHPDALRSASNFERVVREELYKEVNVEIARIDRQQRSP
jgi:hypothetical protein